MKTLFIWLIPVIVLLLNTCGNADEKMGDFRIIPAPQFFEVKGSGSLEFDDLQSFHLEDDAVIVLPDVTFTEIEPVDDPSLANIIGRIDPDLDSPAEGYTLEITKQRVSITGKDDAGLMYGFMTLAQLMEDAREQDVPLPECFIKDYPELSYRAMHLDMKHHREKTSYYYELIDWLASYKVNAIIAEIEDKLAYQSHPDIAAADALSPQEWIKLSNYAMERNIEISPLIQGLGHVSFILKHDQYKHLRDDPESDWAFNPLDEGTYDLQFDLYRDALEVTPYGRYLHVGGDEVHTTGRESGKSPLELQLIWLERVCRFAEENGRTPIVWDDMPLKHAEVYRPMFNPDMNREEVEALWTEKEHTLVEFLDRFPKNCIYMRWNYFHPQSAGNLKAMEWFSEQGLQVMPATAGQTRWKLMPLAESNIENIRSLAITSIENDFGGYLITLWDDDSPHFELYKRGIMAFATSSWSGDALGKEEIKSAYRHREFSNAVSGNSFSFIDRLEETADFWNNALLYRSHRNRMRKMDDPLEEAIIALPDRANKGDWSTEYAERLDKAREMLAHCDSVEQTIDAIKRLAKRNEYRLEVYRQVARLTRFTSEALLALEEYDRASTTEDESRAMEKINQLPAKFVEIRTGMESVYAETRILDKPAGFILDQDHHSHMANQSLNFDWQFQSEMLLLEKIKRELP